MTSTTTARALRDTGLQWRPAKGDRFVIPDREMDDVVFVVSDMTIEAHDLPSGQVLGFNGTTEWALDSVDAAEVLWLPREGQLREHLGGAMVCLRPAGAQWGVTTRRDRGAAQVEATTVAEDTEEAYALALLALRGTTARQLLPVAAGGLAAVLAPLPSATWTTTTPGGALTVADVVAGAVGGLGADPASSWREALAALLEAWTRSLETGAGDGAEATAEASEVAQVAEAGANGVLVDLVGATWDVAVASGAADPAATLDPAVVACALAHVRTWPTSASGEASTAAGAGGGDALVELLELTGRQPATTG